MNKARKNRRQRKRYQDRLSKGVCPMCGGKRDNGWIICATCRTRNSNYASSLSRERRNQHDRNYRDKRKKEGRCISCGVRLQGDTHVRCEKCREKQRGYEAKYRLAKTLKAIEAELSGSAVH